LAKRLIREGRILKMMDYKIRWSLVGILCALLVSTQACAPAALKEKPEGAKVTGVEIGTQDLHLAASLNEEARLHYRQGKYAEAEPLYKRALTISEKTLGPEHPRVAAILNNLALLYKRQSKYDEA
jgi:tetratricopeptide (TPR) repeat protein